jgi:hypothetical protein
MYKIPAASPSDCFAEKPAYFNGNLTVKWFDVICVDYVHAGSFCKFDISRTLTAMTEENYCVFLLH